VKARFSLLLIAAAATLALPPLAAAATPHRTSLTAIEYEVMCPICGTLLALSDSPQAQREKVFIANLIAAGKTKQQVKDTLVAEYGDSVLALPQGSGFDLSAYLVPVIGFVIAVIALAIGVIRWRRAAQPPGSGPPAASGPSGDDAKRLDADLARYDL
jgi:cytochrome c-type biogenesis protein CcmH